MLYRDAGVKAVSYRPQYTDEREQPPDNLAPDP